MTALLETVRELVALNPAWQPTEPGMVGYADQARARLAAAGVDLARREVWDAVAVVVAAMVTTPTDADRLRMLDGFGSLLATTPADRAVR